ncbi:MAG: hypothetical protein ABUS57_10865 [Pseudomonadota bacterium]
MSKRHILIALALLAGSCASQRERVLPIAENAPQNADLVNAPEEFHGATVGHDSLRGALPAEN